MGNSVEGIAKFGKMERAFRVDEGHVYIVSPLNPAKLRHRGRMCRVITLLECGRADVLFHDSQRRGRVRTGDLIVVTMHGAKSIEKAQAKAMMRTFLTGPNAGDPRVEVLLDKWWRAMKAGEASPDGPDYLYEAMVLARGLVSAAEVAAAIGEMHLAIDDLEPRLLETVTRTLNGVDWTSEEEMATALKIALQAPVDEALSRIERAKEMT